MKIQLRTRKLTTPQTSPKFGKVQTDVNGEPVYTTYIKGAESQHKLRKHMKKYFNRVIELLEQIEADGGVIADVLQDTFHLDINHKKQLGCDPYAKDWTARFDMVDKYVNGKGVYNDLTLGVVDDYNIVIEDIYKNTGINPIELKRIMIEVFDAEKGQYLEILNPDLFEY